AKIGAVADVAARTVQRSRQGGVGADELAGPLLARSGEAVLSPLPWGAIQCKRRWSISSDVVFGTPRFDLRPAGKITACLLPGRIHDRPHRPAALQLCPGDFQAGGFPGSPVAATDRRVGRKSLTGDRFDPARRLRRSAGKVPDSKRSSSG